MLKPIKIVDFTEDELGKISTDTLSNKERAQFKERVMGFLEKHPEDIGALVMATEMTDDIIESNAYLSRFLKLVDEKRDFSHYMAAIYLSRLHNRIEVVEGFYRKAKAKYPVRARIANFLLNVYLSRKQR